MTRIQLTSDEPWALMETVNSLLRYSYSDVFKGSSLARRDTLRRFSANSNEGENSMPRILAPLWHKVHATHHHKDVLNIALWWTGSVSVVVPSMGESVNDGNIAAFLKRKSSLQIKSSASGYPPSVVNTMSLVSI